VQDPASVLLFGGEEQFLNRETRNINEIEMVAPTGFEPVFQP
jgi:hypothetical protein